MLVEEKAHTWHDPRRGDMVATNWSTQHRPCDCHTATSQICAPDHPSSVLGPPV